NGCHGRNCRGGPPWPPDRTHPCCPSDRVATEGHPYSYFYVALVFCWLIVGGVSVSAQQQPVSIYGTVTDPNGDAIQHATVEFETDGKTSRTVTDLSGDFTVLSPRAY